VIGLPIIQVQVLEGRSDEKIKELIAGITEATVRTLEVNSEQVRIIVQPVPHKFWGAGGITKDEQKSQLKK
jgi:4-oxalocrotonate tautomerase